MEPIQQFVNGFELLFPAGIALFVATILVILSQMKINVTNAYAGSLAWSDFSSRIFHWVLYRPRRLHQRRPGKR